MKKILFYIRTNQFGVKDFMGYKSLKDFYNTTTTSLRYSSNLHPLEPLETHLIPDMYGQELLKDCGVEFGKIGVVAETHNLIDLFEYEFPALMVQPTVIPFYDIPLNLYNSKLLCFNVHKLRPTDMITAARIMWQVDKRDTVMQMISKAIANKEMYSMNTCILGSAESEFLQSFAKEVKFIQNRYPKINNDPLFFEFIQNVYLYYYAQLHGVKIDTVNPYIPEEDYTNFKYFLTERLCIYIVGDKQNELTMNAIAKISNSK